MLWFRSCPQSELKGWTWTTRLFSLKNWRPSLAHLKIEPERLDLLPIPSDWRSLTTVDDRRPIGQQVTILERGGVVLRTERAESIVSACRAPVGWDTAYSSIFPVSGSTMRCFTFRKQQS